MVRKTQAPFGVTDEEPSDERGLYGDPQHESPIHDGSFEQTIYGDPQHQLGDVPALDAEPTLYADRPSEWPSDGDWAADDGRKSDRSAFDGRSARQPSPTAFEVSLS